MRFKSYSLLFAAALAFSSCGKEFLDEKKNAKEVILRTVNDYQMVLDNLTIVNTFSSVSLNLASAAEFELPDAQLTTWKVNMPYEVNGYLWEKEIFEGKESTDYNNAYQRIMLANLALDVQKVSPTNAAEQTAKDNVLGSAHFIRAFSYYQLAQLFCKPYDASTATTDPGVPIRTDYDIKVKIPSRGTVSELYKFIIADLEAALPLVPETPLNIWRPGKAAVAGMLARVYMQMGNWEKVREYSDMALKVKSNLVDFAKYIGQASFPSDYGKTMPEIVFYSQIHKPSFTYTGMTAAPNIYALYETDDHRKSVYFAAPPNTSFKGSLAGLYAVFAGITTSELYLQRAEAYARLGQVANAMADVNELRRFRFPSGKAPVNITDQTAAVQFIIDERARELYLRGTRWEDLRRLSKEPQYAITLSHTYNGNTYTLKPGDNRWTMPLPDNEIQLNNYPQNPR
jgi:tetratricopeptide (TPR) repeat protein